jgi:flagellar hook-associated protein 1 FlgK
MTKIGSILDIAKSALLTSQYAIEVSSHNIANVNTEGYSRQTPVIDAQTPVSYNGLTFGSGVNISEVIRQSNECIETRLQEGKSDLTALDEKEIYMSILESIFDESSEAGLSTQLDEFWNAWQDLANNPSGSSERTVLCETVSLLTEAFSNLDSDLSQIEEDLDLSIAAGVEKINELTSKISALNKQIVSLGSNANDLLDQRDALVGELAEYIDIKTYQDSDGQITVATGNGSCPLVSKTESYQLELNGDRVEWVGSGGNRIDLTDKIAGGKMGGWLDMRDATIPEYAAELDELAKALIWEVNCIHTQGVGLEGFSSVTGTYVAADSAEEIGTLDSGLDFYDGIVDGTFKLWLYDDSGELVGGGPTTITIDADAGGTTLDSLAAMLSGIDTNLAATVSGGKLRITASNGYTFAFSDDTSNALAAIGINTCFDGSDAASIKINSLLDSEEGFIAAGCVDSDTGQIAAGDNSNALKIADLQYQDVSLKQWTFERGSSPESQDVKDSLKNYLYSLVSSIGSQSQSITSQKEYTDTIVSQLSEVRDSISAVNLDEEVTDLIKYQQAYAAASKLIATAEEMLEVLIELI